MIRFSILLLAVGASLVSAGAGSAEPVRHAVNAKPVFGPLDSAQQQQIQMVGRAVLAAKSVRQSVAEEDDLQTQLHVLYESVESALQLKVPTAPTLGISPAGITTHQVQAARIGNHAKINDQIAPHVVHLHEIRTRIDQLTPRDDLPQHQIHRVQHQAHQAGQLEQAVLSALAVSDDAERYKRLADLRQQLRPRTAEEHRTELEQLAIEAGQENVPATPTFVTLTQHRPGLDNSRPGKR